MNFSQQFPKTGAALEHTRYDHIRKPLFESKEHSDAVDEAWNKHVAFADHGDFLNLTDTILEPTVEQLDALLNRIGGDLRVLTLSGIFSRMARRSDKIPFMNHVLRSIVTHCSRGNLERLTVSRDWDYSYVNTDTLKMFVTAAPEFHSSIRYLDFSRLLFDESYTFVEFISKCRRLETLILAKSTFAFCAGRPFPVPLDVPMPHLKHLDIDRTFFCYRSEEDFRFSRFPWEEAFGKSSSQAKYYPRPCSRCDPNRYVYRYLLEDYYGERVDSEDGDDEIGCCYPPDMHIYNHLRKFYNDKFEIERRTQDVIYRYYSAMMDMLPALEYLDMSKMTKWVAVKKYLQKNNRVLKTVRFVQQDEIERVDKYDIGKRLSVKSKRKHADDCPMIRAYRDYPYDSFWRDFPAHKIIRDANFEDVLERIANGQDPGVRTRVIVSHALIHLPIDCSKNDVLMRLFWAYHCAWKKFSFDEDVHKSYTYLLEWIAAMYDESILLDNGFTPQLFDEAIREVVRNPPSTNLPLIPLLFCFYCLAPEGMSIDTLVELLAAMEQSTADTRYINSIEKKGECAYKWLKDEYELSFDRLLSGDKKIIPQKRRTWFAGQALNSVELASGRKDCCSTRPKDCYS